MEDQAKRLYNDLDHRLTAEGAYLDEAVAHVLRPVLEHWFKQGFSPREIYAVVSFCLMDMCLMQVLDWPAKTPEV